MMPATRRGSLGIAATISCDVILTITAIAMAAILVAPGGAIVGLSRGSVNPRSIISAAFAIETPLSCSAIYSNLPVNDTITQLTPPLPNVSQDEHSVMEFFWELCGQAQFLTLVNEWSWKNLSFDLKADHAILALAAFNLMWQNWSAGVKYYSEASWIDCFLTGALYEVHLSSPQNVSQGSTAGSNCSLSFATRTSSPFAGGLANVVLPGAIAVAAATSAIYLLRARTSRRR